MINTDTEPHSNDEDDEKHGIFVYMLAILSILFTICLGIYMVTDSLSEIRGQDFPQINELKYSEGILRAYHQRFDESDGDGTRDILMVRLLNQKSSDALLDNSYYCNYMSKHDPRTSFCLKEEDIFNHRKKYAKIGWYIPKPFLWHKNPYPQIVTLEVENKLILSYDFSKYELEKKRKMDKIFYGIAIVFFGGACLFLCIYYWFIDYPFQIKRGFKWLLRS